VKKVKVVETKPFELRSVVDGDTVLALIDLKYNDLYHLRKIRFAKTYAPEMKQGLGPAARDFVVGWFKNKSNFRVEFERDHEDEKFGRLLGTIYAESADGQTHCLNVDIVESGHASMNPPIKEVSHG
jgi:endonuclease YncB( thermonuclease family)